jgi:hypothetical protein
MENYLVILEIRKSRKQRHLQQFPNEVQQEGENRNSGALSILFLLIDVIVWSLIYHLNDKPVNGKQPDCGTENN